MNGPLTSIEMDALYKSNLINDITEISFQKTLKFFHLAQFFSYHHNKKLHMDQQAKINEANWRERQEQIQREQELKKAQIPPPKKIDI